MHRIIFKKLSLLKHPKTMIKKLSLFVTIAILFGGLTSFSSSSSGSTSIAVKKGKITINGVAILPSWGLDLCKKALGEPDRSRDGYNKTHTYDTKCVVLFEKVSNKVATGTVSEIQAHYSVPSANDVTPKGDGYSGKLTVDKLKVTSSLTATEMKAKLKNWKVTDSYLEHSYRMASSGIYIYFQFNEAETQLVKVSIGPDKKK
jgi:hypothetical protein